MRPPYARSLIEAGLDPLVTISPEGTTTDFLCNASGYRGRYGPGDPGTKDHAAVRAMPADDGGG